MKMDEYNRGDWKNWYKKRTKLIEGPMKWPHTKVISNTLDPKWKGEINFKVRTHDSSGVPVDLTGAMLHILVLDTKDNFSLIGSCSLNLASLIVGSLAKKTLAEGSSSIKEETADTKTLLAVTFATRLLGLNKSKAPRKSSASTFGRKERRRFRFSMSSASKAGPHVSDANGTPGDVEKDSPIVIDDLSTKNNPLHSALPAGMGDSEPSKNVSTPATFAPDYNTAHLSESAISGEASSQYLGVDSQCIDEILTRNGKEVGSIKFRIETLWLYDGELSKLPKRSGSKK